MSESEKEILLETLRMRFEKNPKRHPGLSWDTVRERLEKFPDKLISLQAMESSGGEPDVTFFDTQSGNLCFMDCSPESPAGRRSLCYDPEALEARKEFKPAHSALGMAEEMGVQLLDEADYRYLQALGSFDAKTSSWLLTPSGIRKRGGAIFGDFRYGQVFIYHNGVQSYYAARGFRAKIVL